MIIESLADDPVRLQAFAHNMSDQQFAKLLNELNAEGIKDIIHKLPYEKVTAVIGDVGNKDQSKAIINVLKEKFDDQNKNLKEIYEKLKEFELPPAYNEALESPCSTTHILQDANAEFAAKEGYAQYEFGYL